MSIIDDQLYHVVYFEETDKFVIKPKVAVPSNGNGVHK